MKIPRFPVSVKRGSVVTRVYRLKRGDGREIYTAAWTVGGQRHTRQFPSFSTAHAEAALKAEQIAAGKIDAAASLTSEDGATLREARRLCGSTPILAVIKEWARARDLTGGNVLAAAEAWKARNVAKIARKKVADVVKEFCTAKKAAGFNVAEDHSSAFKNLTDDLGAEFIDVLSVRKLEAWLAKRENPVTRNTYRKRLVSVWRWAQKRGYLPRDVKTEAEQTERARETAPPIGIISAVTWGQFLALVREKAPALLASAAIAGFCGLRRSELHAQVWEDISLEKRFLRVTKGKRGTPARRLVPLPDAAVEWLMLCKDRKGLIGPNLAVDQFRKLARASSPKIELPENCFRHGFISHRVAASGSVAETALESGNSPQIIHRHYRELVTKAEGEAWFEVRPSNPGKAVRLA